MFFIVNLNFSSHLLDRTLDMKEQAITANDGGDAQSSEITTF